MKIEFWAIFGPFRKLGFFEYGAILNLEFFYIWANLRVQIGLISLEVILRSLSSGQIAQGHIESHSCQSL